MLEETRKFYEKTKLESSAELPSEEPPITHIKVFRKEYPRLPVIELPPAYDEGQLDTLLSMRESTREFSETPLPLSAAAKILGSCRIADALREPERRTYPSGGARFPVEIYLIAFNIGGLEAGAYHYNIKNEKLEQLLKQDLRSRRRDFISPYLENPAGTVVFTSVIPRSEVKYGYKAYPFSLIEAGHMGQNMQLKSAEIGVGCCSVSGFVNDTVSEILDLTDEEIPLYTISMGIKKG